MLTELVMLMEENLHHVTKAAYKAAMEGTKEALWLRTLMEDFRFPQVLPLTIKCDH